MQKKKPRERCLVLDLSCARCRDCLLSPSHRQFVGGLRLSDVGCTKEIRIWPDCCRPRGSHRVVFLGAGSPAVVSLNASNFEQFGNAFNDDAHSTRAVLLLSPT